MFSLLLGAMLVYAHAGIGCIMGLLLIMASTLLLGGTALALGVISARLRLAGLGWLAAALLSVAFATGLALELLLAVACGKHG